MSQGDKRVFEAFMRSSQVKDEEIKYYISDISREIEDVNIKLEHVVKEIAENKELYSDIYVRSFDYMSKINNSKSELIKNLSSFIEEAKRERHEFIEEVVKPMNKIQRDILN